MYIETICISCMHLCIYAKYHFCHTQQASRRGTHALPPSPIHLRRPPASRLWVSSVAETRRVCNASRLEMWLRCSTWLHLHFPYGCAAQLHSSESAFGAMPPLT